jgi:hypothetical protein
LVAAAAVEPELTEAVAEGRRRHRRGARLTVDRIAELGGLRADLPRERAAALISVTTAHEGWRELVEVHGLTWDEAESWLSDALGRALLTDA